MAEIQIMIRTFPEQYMDDGLRSLNDLLKLGCKVIAAYPWYDEKGRIMGHDFLIEGKRKCESSAKKLKDFAEIIISDYPEMEYYIDDLVKEMIGEQE